MQKNVNGVLSKDNVRCHGLDDRFRHSHSRREPCPCPSAFLTMTTIILLCGAGAAVWCLLNPPFMLATSISLSPTTTSTPFSAPSARSASKFMSPQFLQILQSRLKILEKSLIYEFPIDPTREFMPYFETLSTRISASNHRILLL